ncbi:hypothetical protein RESH_00557 [Rhodopirellula europaea SH398]|uniref:Uncharacterized protein n=1 Tax=Rhodopirellula europaea SH398 TaxID=1263868 RepID=M5SB80_9BACT|nr:hypothetical protein RESH_00557 [Rhodopirellula europaea SH398]
MNVLHQDGTARPSGLRMLVVIDRPAELLSLKRALGFFGHRTSLLEEE